MTTASMNRAISERIRASLPHLVALRHDLHRHPEIGFQERYTSALVQRELKSIGVDFVHGLAGGTGVLAHLPGDGAAATGLRADMDALPIHEETGLDYASMNAGFMHACGHDGHTTILLGAARILAEMARESALPYPVAFLFQPAEEGFGGGRRMIEDGCLDGSRLGPNVGRMFGLHGWPQMPLNTVGTRPGPLLAAADNFTVTVRGRGGHAAMPHLGHDPIVAGAAIVSALQSIASRSVNPLDAVVVSVTMFHAGSAHNVIPDQAVLEGTVRTLRPETQTLVKQRMEEVIRGVSAAHGCVGTLEYRPGYPVTRNDADAVATFESVAFSALGKERVHRVAEPVMGAEDFSYYCQHVPSCFFFLGLLPPEKSAMAQLHTSTFDFNDEAIATGVELFVRLALSTT